MPEVTFASFLSAAGAGIAAGIITGLVQLLKGVFPGPLEGRGAQAAFILSAILYTLTGIATGVSTLDAGLIVVIAWLTCATAAVGVYVTIQRAQGG